MESRVVVVVADDVVVVVVVVVDVVVVVVDVVISCCCCQGFYSWSESYNIQSGLFAFLQAKLSWLMFLLRR